MIPTGAVVPNRLRVAVVASDAAMRPESRKNHFGGGCGSASIFSILYAEAANMLHQSLNFRKLLVAIRSSGNLGKL